MLQQGKYNKYHIYLSKTYTTQKQETKNKWHWSVHRLANKRHRSSHNVLLYVLVINTQVFITTFCHKNTFSKFMLETAKLTCQIGHGWVIVKQQRWFQTWLDNSIRSCLTKQAMISISPLPIPISPLAIPTSFYYNQITWIRHIFTVVLWSEPKTPNPADKMIWLHEAGIHQKPSSLDYSLKNDAGFP